MQDPRQCNTLLAVLEALVKAVASSAVYAKAQVIHILLAVLEALASADTGSSAHARAQVTPVRLT